MMPTTPFPAPRVETVNFMMFAAMQKQYPTPPHSAIVPLLHAACPEGPANATRTKAMKLHRIYQLQRTISCVPFRRLFRRQFDERGFGRDVLFRSQVRTTESWSYLHNSHG